MAKGSRPEDEAVPRAARRRRRPPVLDLKATEVGETPKAEQPKAERQEARATADGQGGSFDWRGLAANPLVAGGAGVLAGAILVFALMSLLGGRGGDARVQELSGQVATLTARIEALTNRPVPPAAMPGALTERLDRLTGAINETEQRLAAIERRPAPQAPDLSTVNQRTAAIESTLKDLRGALGELRRMAEQAPPPATPAAIETLAGRIGTLEERIAVLAAPRAAPAAAALAAEIAALNALSAAVQSGRPFLPELEAARARLGERAAALAPLEPFAQKGLPTVAALAERFAALAPALLRAPAPEGGILSRLVANAARLVEVRRVGEPEGTAPDAVVARMETKLGRGDLSGALAEVDMLPAPAKAAAAGWVAAATERRDAERTVRQLIDAALADSTGRRQS